MAPAKGRECAQDRGRQWPAPPKRLARQGEVKRDTAAECRRNPENPALTVSFECASNRAMETAGGKEGDRSDRLGRRSRKGLLKFRNVR